MLPLNPSEFLEDNPIVPLCEKPNEHMNLMYQRYYQTAMKQSECALRASVHKLDTALEFLSREQAASLKIPTLVLSLTTLGISVVMGYTAAANLIQLNDAALAISFVKGLSFIGCAGIMAILCLLIFGGRRLRKQTTQYLLYKSACKHCLDTQTFIGGANDPTADIRSSVQMGTAGSGRQAVVQKELSAVLSGESQI